MNEKMNSALKVERFYSLDALRGIAALSVVLWHWQHFFFVGSKLGQVDITNLPLSDLLFPFYTMGWLAVDLFFCLSGFIFYWLYSEAVAKRSISFGRFALLRFSRLYPLHIVTLAFVALAQFWLFNWQGSYFVYPNNDAKHFLLNLAFASSWGFETGYSFNGPFWSVSVEALLYALFFVMCRLLPVRSVILLAIACIGYFIVKDYYSPIGRGIGSFFIGGIVFSMYQKIVKSRHRPVLTKLVAILSLCVWITTVAFHSSEIDLNSVSLRSIPFVWRLDAYLHKLVNASLGLWPTFVLFPVTILTLATAEAYRGTLGKRISFIGDISYSSYLLHFPLQLIAYRLMIGLGVGESIYYSPWFMATFYAILILLCFCSYRYLEMPSQRFLRQYGLKLRIGAETRRQTATDAPSKKYRQTPS